MEKRPMMKRMYSKLNAGARNSCEDETRSDDMLKGHGLRRELESVTPLRRGKLTFPL
jgi:hypothetical protein